MKVKVNDNVLVAVGKDKGKSGKITRILKKANKVIVEKVNIKTKHIKKTQQRPGEIVHFEAPLTASNVEIICPRCNKKTRVQYSRLENGKKQRTCKKCKESLDQVIKKSSKK